MQLNTDTQIKQNTLANQANNSESIMQLIQNPLTTTTTWRTLSLLTAHCGNTHFGNIIQQKHSLSSVSNSIRWKITLLNYCYSLDQWFSKCGPWPASSKSPGLLIEMQIPVLYKPDPDLQTQKFCGRAQESVCEQALQITNFWFCFPTPHAVTQAE